MTLQLVVFSLNCDNLTIINKGGGIRKLNITAGEYDTIVEIKQLGDIAEWITVSDNNFFIKPYESREIKIHVNVPDDIVPLAYRNGTLKIIFKRKLI